MLLRDLRKVEKKLKEKDRLELLINLLLSEKYMCSISTISNSLVISANISINILMALLKSISKSEKNKSNKFQVLFLLFRSGSKWLSP